MNTLIIGGIIIILMIQSIFSYLFRKILKIVLIIIAIIFIIGFIKTAIYGKQKYDDDDDDFF
jgi:hypothetical protein